MFGMWGVIGGWILRSVKCFRAAAWAKTSWKFASSGLTEASRRVQDTAREQMSRDCARAGIFFFIVGLFKGIADCFSWES